MADWNLRLARGYAACRASHPEDTAVVVVGVDGVLADGDGELQAGVADVVGLFQMQPLTRVALVDHRPAHGPALDALARDHGVDVAHALRLGGDLGRDGLCVAAAVVRDPAAWEGGGSAGGAPNGGGPDGAPVLDAGEVLAARRRLRPGAGREPVELVWHRVNQPVGIQQFLASPFRWAEIDVRCDARGRLVVQHDDIDEADGELAPAGEVLAAFREAGKGVKVDVKTPGRWGSRSTPWPTTGSPTRTSGSTAAWTISARTAWAR